jgi:putative transposase
MPRRIRSTLPNCPFHVLNRAVRRAQMFDTTLDYLTFEQALMQAVHRDSVRLLAYCAMPNHWHLVVWPTDVRQLSRFMHWFTGTHARRWHAIHQTGGTGAVYQSRFKSIPVFGDADVWRVCRYVERNPVRGHLVDRAEQWRWSSLWRRANLCADRWLEPVPHMTGGDWIDYVNRPLTAAELAVGHR